MNDISPEIVRAVNLAYHEEEAAEYDSRHPEIFTDELGHWSRIAESVAALKKELGRPIKILDLGSGTGFVPLRLASVLGAEDEFTLTDLSPMMLTRARESLEAAGFTSRTAFVEAGAESLTIPPGTVDVVTMNSVLHHLPSPDQVFAAAHAMLRPGGLVVIAHEPTLLHFHHPVVGSLDRLIRFLREAKSGKPPAVAEPGSFITRVNARLLERGVVKEAMSVEKIESIVDIHSPTAGRSVDAARGFDPRGLAAASFPGYAIIRLETYRHFGKLDVAKRPWLARVQRVLERLWPEAGALFLLIIKKPKV